VPFNYTESSFRIADIYKSVEQEAYNILGKQLILVRFVFPPGLKGAHLLPERIVPSEYMSKEEILGKINEYSTTLPVHFIEDDPVLCGVDLLVDALAKEGRELYLNTCGLFSIAPPILEKIKYLYVQSKPGLPPRAELLAKASEIRAYWKLHDSEYQEHVRDMDSAWGAKYRDKMYLNPYNVDSDSLKETMQVAMEIGWNFGLRLSSIAPETDQFLQNVPEAEDVYHRRYKEALGLTPPPPNNPYQEYAKATND
jgi:hypothetical protein